MKFESSRVAASCSALDHVRRRNVRGKPDSGQPLVLMGGPESTRMGVQSADTTVVGGHLMSVPISSPRFGNAFMMARRSLGCSLRPELAVRCQACQGLQGALGAIGCQIQIGSLVFSRIVHSHEAATCYYRYDVCLYCPRIHRGPSCYRN